MQLSLQKAFLSEYNRQERFYSKHNHYATNQSNNHPLQCNERKPPIDGGLLPQIEVAAAKVERERVKFIDLINRN